MPVTGEIDVSGIIAKLGDPSHGLRPAGAPANTAEHNPESVDVFRASWGIVDVSTNMDLAVIPRLVHDVNGYYRALGIEPPFKPNRKQLRLAYQAKNGQDSEYLTYILKQLLNPKVRQEYDSQLLGHRMEDKYTILENMKKLAKVAAEVSEESGKVVTVDNLIEEERESRPKELDRNVKSTYWQWGYYLLKSRKYDSENLAEWQTMLIKAFAERGVVRTISVGYIGKTTKPFFVKEHEDHLIFFLNEEIDPTTELAETVVSLNTAHIKGKEEA